MKLLQILSTSSLVLFGILLLMIIVLLFEDYVTPQQVGATIVVLGAWSLSFILYVFIYSFKK